MGRVLFNQGELVVMVSIACHHGLPPPGGQEMQGALFTQWTPDNKHVNVLPNTTHLDPPTDPPLKNFLGTLEQQEVCTYGQLLFVWGGLEAHLGLAVEDLRDDVFNPPPTPGSSRPPRVHPPSHLLHPLGGGSPTLVGPWRGPYQLELAKDERTDGDALVQWALLFRDRCLFLGDVEQLGA